MKLLIIVVLAVVIGVPIVAGRFLPWWGTLLVLATEIVVILSAGPRLIAYIIRKHLVGVFLLKSRVLKDAQVLVHSVADQGTVAEDDKPRRHILVDFTITPQPNQSPMAFYDPLEFMLVPEDATVSIEEDATDDDTFAMATQVRLVDEKGEESECDKLSGPARLRIIFALEPKLTGRAKFRYYFEQFGEVSLP